MSRLPLIGVTACTKQIGFHSYHAVSDQYVRALVLGAGDLPLVIPALGNSLDLPVLPTDLDGLRFTGSPFSAEPHHCPSSIPGTAHTPQRDHNSLLLIKAVITAGVPVLGICPRYPAASHVATSSKSASPRTLSGFR